MLPFGENNRMPGEDLSCAEYRDEDEQFVLFKCAGYMKRLLSLRPVYDKETIGFLLWLLKAKRTRFYLTWQPMRLQT